MRAVLALFTALPLGPRAREEAPVWPAGALVGAGIGVIWFIFHQLAVNVVGPLVAGSLVVAVGAALTGGRGFRGLHALAEQLAARSSGPLAPPPAGVGALAVTLVGLTQVTLLQRVTLAPALIVIVPMAGRLAQVLLTDDADDLGVDAPSGADRVAAVVLGAVLLLLPIGAAVLERPLRVNGPVQGLGYPLLGLAATVAAVLVGLLTRTWLRARFGGVQAAGWHFIGLLAETAALVMVAARIA